MKRQIRRNALISLAVALLALVPALSRSAAAQAPQQQGAVIQVSIEASEAPENGFTIAAHALTTASKPLNGVPLEFYVVADLFGPRRMLVGTETTDGQGWARLRYLPAWEGEQSILVRFGGSAAATAAEGQTSVVVPVAPAAQSAGSLIRHNQQLALASFSARVPYVVGAVVAAVWLTLAFALFGTAYRLLMSGRTAPEPVVARVRVALGDGSGDGA